MSRFENILALLQSKDPNINIKYKDESKFMQLLGKIMFFNKNFSGCITTIGKTIYFPSKDFIELNRYRSVHILLHEYQHIKDEEKYGILFKLGYLFPQILALFAILGFFNWWFLLFLIFLAPLPAHFRTFFEYNAYKVSMVAINELLKEKGHDKESRKIQLFIASAPYQKALASADYYWGWPFDMSKKFDDAAYEILEEPAEYSEIREILTASK